MEAFEDIYRQFHSKVLSYIRSRVQRPEDAEDLCSAVFERVLLGWDTYDENKGSVSTWIYQITRNTVLNHLRAQRPTEELDDNLAAAERIDDDLLWQESLAALAEALKRLSRQERDILILHYDKEWTLKEISARTHIPYRTVKLRKQEALARLRLLMK